MHLGRCQNDKSREMRKIMHENSQRYFTYCYAKRLLRQTE